MDVRRETITEFYFEPYEYDAVLLKLFPGAGDGGRGCPLRGDAVGTGDGAVRCAETRGDGGRQTFWGSG